MSDIVLSSATRANLLALQNTSVLQSTVQNRLATGKKVNSALDNATSFFTAAGFTNRATSLTSLLDSLSTGVQTMQAANNGITSITKLVAQLRSTAQQALQSTSAFTTQAKISSTVPVTGATSADIRGNGIAATASGTGALTTLTDAKVATVNGAATDFSGLTSASTITVGDGAITKTYTFSTSATTDPTKFNSLSDLNARLVADGIKVTADFNGGSNSNKLEFLGKTTAVTNITASEGGINVLGITTTTGAATLGDALTISDGATSKTYTYDSSAAGTSDPTKFSSIADLNTKLAASGVKATAAETSTGSGLLKLTATTSGTALIVSGAAQGSTKLNIASTINPVGALNGKSMTFTMSDGTSTNVVFGDPSVPPGGVKTLDDFNTTLATIGLSATLDGSGGFSFSTTSATASKTFSISGSATGGTGTSFATLGSTSPSRGGTGADARDSLVTQYNGLLTQINSLAKDAGFNGINLLAGDTLSLIFNEKNTSRLDIAGTSADASGLGLANVAASDFNDGKAINGVLTNLDRVTSQLQSQASRLGSQLAVTQTRQDFTKQMVNTLQVGSDNLVNADMNEEGANLLALNTQQQLSQSALSLATQSAQSVLKLLQG